jgi:hypothetical protein
VGSVVNPDIIQHYHAHVYYDPASSADVPMHQDVVGAIVVEVAHGVHDPIRSAHGNLELSLDPTRVHLIDQKLPGPGGRIINVDEELEAQSR